MCLPMCSKFVTIFQVLEDLLNEICKSLIEAEVHFKLVDQIRQNVKDEVALQINENDTVSDKRQKMQILVYKELLKVKLL